ncbi:MAG: tRNA (adenosine(37)-N6)-threonylcarbamoyltransferase complex dimerization subunit type 1 TsaB [Pseudomonadota bacterium]
MILAIDTSAGQCAVALLDGARSEVRSEAMQRGHAEALFPMIEDALAVLRGRYSDLTRIAVCTGPGSFTGLRVGIAAARGIALGCGIPAIGVTRFEALAADHSLPCTIALPGRGGAIYLQAFGEDAIPVGEPYFEAGEAKDALPDPMRIARIALNRAPGVRPAPLYLRDADAALPREGPPPLLD